MKTAPLFLGILLTLLLLVNFSYAAEENIATFQPGQGVDSTKTGEDQDEKFKFLPDHQPLFKKPFLKPIPHPIVKKRIPHPIVKRPIPRPIVKKPIPHPIVKKPIPHYPFHPPVFPSHP